MARFTIIPSISEDVYYKFALGHYGDIYLNLDGGHYIELLSLTLEYYSQILNIETCDFLKNLMQSILINALVSNENTEDLKRKSSYYFKKDQLSIFYNKELNSFANTMSTPIFWNYQNEISECIRNLYFMKDYETIEPILINLRKIYELIDKMLLKSYTDNNNVLIGIAKHHAHGFIIDKENLTYVNYGSGLEELDYNQTLNKSCQYIFKKSENSIYLFSALYALQYTHPIHDLIMAQMNLLKIYIHDQKSFLENIIEPFTLTGQTIRYRFRYSFYKYEQYLFNPNTATQTKELIQLSGSCYYKFYYSYIKFNNKLVEVELFDKLVEFITEYIKSKKVLKYRQLKVISQFSEMEIGDEDNSINIEKTGLKEIQPDFLSLDNYKFYLEQIEANSSNRTFINILFSQIFHQERFSKVLKSMIKGYIPITIKFFLLPDFIDIICEPKIIYYLLILIIKKNESIIKNTVSRAINNMHIFTGKKKIKLTNFDVSIMEQISKLNIIPINITINTWLKEIFNTLIVDDLDEKIILEKIEEHNRMFQGKEQPLTSIKLSDIINICKKIDNFDKNILACMILINNLKFDIEYKIGERLFIYNEGTKEDFLNDMFNSNIISNYYIFSTNLCQFNKDIKDVELLKPPLYYYNFKIISRDYDKITSQRDYGKSYLTNVKYYQLFEKRLYTPYYLEKIYNYILNDDNKILYGIFIYVYVYLLYKDILKQPQQKYDEIIKKETKNSFSSFYNETSLSALLNISHRITLSDFSYLIYKLSLKFIKEKTMGNKNYYKNNLLVNILNKETDCIVNYINSDYIFTWKNSQFNNVDKIVYNRNEYTFTKYINFFSTNDEKNYVIISNNILINITNDFIIIDDEQYSIIKGNTFWNKYIYKNMIYIVTKNEKRYIFILYNVNFDYNKLFNDDKTTQSLNNTSIKQHILNPYLIKIDDSGFYLDFLEVNGFEEFYENKLKCFIHKFYAYFQMANMAARYDLIDVLFPTYVALYNYFLNYELPNINYINHPYRTLYTNILIGDYRYNELININAYPTTYTIENIKKRFASKDEYVRINLSVEEYLKKNLAIVGKILKQPSYCKEVDKKKITGNLTEIIEMIKLKCNQDFPEIEDIKDIKCDSISASTIISEDTKVFEVYPNLYTTCNLLFLMNQIMSIHNKKIHKLTIKLCKELLNLVTISKECNKVKRKLIENNITSIYTKNAMNHVVLFEALFDNFLRVDQMEIYESIINTINTGTTNKIFNLLMGRGKTSVILPLLVLYIAYTNPDLNITIILPDNNSLINQTITILSNYSYLFPFYTIVDLNNINNNHGETKGIYISSDKKIKELFLNYWRSDIKQNKLIDKIKTSFIIIDEFDSVYNPLTSELKIINSIYSTNKTYHQNITSLCYKVINNICTKKTSIENLSNIDKVFSFLDRSEILNIGKYIEKTDFTREDSETYKIYSSIYKSLPILHKLKIDKNYGVDDSSNILKYVIPYAYLRTPLYGSQFSNDIIRVILTIYYIYNCDLERYRKIILNLQYNCIIDNSHQYCFYKYFKRTDNISTYLTNPHNLFTDKIEFNDAMREYLINLIITEGIFYPIQSYSSITFMDILLPTYSFNKTGFSGTITFELPKYPVENKSNFTGIVKDEYSTLLVKYAITGCINKVEVIKQNNDDELIKWILGNINNYNVLVDVGAFFKLDIYIEIERLLKYLNKDIKYFIFVSDNIYYINCQNIGELTHENIYKNKIQLTQEKNNSIVTELEENKVKFFIFYDHPHIVGIDIKQPLYMKCIVTVDAINDLTEVSQGAFRARQLNYGHHLDFVTLIDVKTGDELYETLCKNEEYNYHMKLEKTHEQNVQLLIKNAENKFNITIYNPLDMLASDYIDYIKKNIIVKNTDIDNLVNTYCDSIKKQINHDTSTCLEVTTQKTTQKTIELSIEKCLAFDTYGYLMFNPLTYTNYSFENLLNNQLIVQCNNEKFNKCPLIFTTSAYYHTVFYFDRAKKQCRHLLGSDVFYFMIIIKGTLYKYYIASYSDYVILTDLVTNKYNGVNIIILNSNFMKVYSNRFDRKLNDAELSLYILFIHLVIRPNRVFFSIMEEQSQKEYTEFLAYYYSVVKTQTWYFNVPVRLSFDSLINVSVGKLIYEIFDDNVKKRLNDISRPV